MTSSFKIGDRLIGAGAPCFIVAEVGQAHDGSLGTAHAYIDAAAKTGVDAVKFQTHIAKAESTPGEPFRVQFSKQDVSRYEYWQRMEFTLLQWQGLYDHATESGLVFLSSPFSSEAVSLLTEIGCPAWKVGAGETSNTPLLKELAKTGKPVLLSSGMSDFSELDAAVAQVRSEGAPIALYQCTSAYPCPPEKLGLNVLSILRDRYQCPVGLSDHSGSHFAGLGAVSLGAKLLEVHMTFSRECFGPDVSSSLTLPELAELVRGVRFLEKAFENPIEKNVMAEELSELRALFNKSIIVLCSKEKGTVLTKADLGLRKPGTGIPASRLDELVGKRLSKNVKECHLLQESDLV